GAGANCKARISAPFPETNSWASMELMMYASSLPSSYVLPPDTILHTQRGRRVTEFWKNNLTAFVKKYVESRGETQIINLMAAVPRREIDFSQIKADVYEVSFMEIASTGNLHCTSSWRLNRLRANLVEFIAQNRVNDIEGLKKFDFEGFRFSPERSSEKLIVYYKV
ncbi:MAG: peroxide stress protein YaaA, partial [Bacteroidales bacterium]|nr:peroxide stress protein YaaA [Bacteroidales bacterium]